MLYLSMNISTTDSTHGENLHKDPGFRTFGRIKNYFLYMGKP
jgi:hypothetical protein